MAGRDVSSTMVQRIGRRYGRLLRPYLVPVIANGDIGNKENADEALKRSGAQGADGWSNGDGRALASGSYCWNFGCDP